MQNTPLDLAILALLLALFGTVDRMAYDRRCRFWLLGWIAVVCSLLLPTWTSEDRLLTLIGTGLHLALLTFAGISFLFSFLPRCPRWQVVSVASRFAAPSLILTFLSLASPHRLWAMVLTILLGEVIAVVEARRLLGSFHPAVRLAAQGIALASGLLMLAAAPTRPWLIPNLILTQLFLLAAIGLRNHCAEQQTRGCLAGLAGLLSWAAVFPLQVLLHGYANQYVPGSLSGNLWDLPMFLTAFGMILIVLEENVRRAAQRLEDHSQLFDSHPLPMYLYNIRTLRFLRVNQAAVLHYGYTAEEFAAMSIEQILPPSELPRLHRVLQSEQRRLDLTHGWRHLLKSGRIIEVDIYRHFIDFDHQPSNLVVALDVTQRNAAERRLRQTYKLESLGQLTGGIAHDFNNLLAVLMGSLELVDRENPHPQSRSLIQQAILSVRRGTELTRRLLAFSRSQAAAPGAISVGALLDSMSGFLRTSLGTAISLEIVCEPGLWPAAIDPNQLENAILNLSLNARDAMPRGGALRIRVSNQTVVANFKGPSSLIEVGDYVLLTLTDTGSGMPPAVLARATEPFFTTKPPDEGTGLGLSMVNAFLQQAGGSLQIASEPGNGTTIQLYLPRVAHDAPVVSVPEVIADVPVPRGTETILLVEDEETVRQVLAILLRSLGYTVVDTFDGPTALATLQVHPEVDLLLTDVILPHGMDGAALAAQACALHPRLRVLFSSGYTRDVLLRESRIPEDADLLTKPYPIADLAQRLRRVLASEPDPQPASL